MTKHFEVVAKKNEISGKKVGTSQALNFDEMIIQTRFIYFNDTFHLNMKCIIILRGVKDLRLQIILILFRYQPITRWRQLGQSSAQRSPCGHRWSRKFIKLFLITMDFLFEIGWIWIPNPDPSLIIYFIAIRSFLMMVLSHYF